MKPRVAPRAARRGYNSYFQILQTADHVVIIQELIHDARVVPLDGRAHLDATIRQWHGDSRAAGRALP